MQLNDTITYTYQGQEYTGTIVYLDFDCWDIGIEVNNVYQMYKMKDIIIKK